MDRLTGKCITRDEKEQEYKEVILKRDGDKELKIAYEKNLDYYFTLSNFGMDPTFLIGKDNQEIYDAFDTLYYDIKNANLPITDIDIADIEKRCIENEKLNFHEELGIEEEKRIEEIKRLQAFAQETGLYLNGIIMWHSDEVAKDIPLYLKIEKLKNAYKLTFLKPNCNQNMNFEDQLSLRNYGISIRIRTSGSTYGYFYVPFANLFKTLCNIDLENPQISLAELELDKQIQELGENTLKRVLLKR